MSSDAPAPIYPIGSVVRLKSGGSLMTVEAVNYCQTSGGMANVVTTAWMDEGGHVCRDTFAEALLTK